MSTIPERHVRHYVDPAVARCRWCRFPWPCDAITEHRERVAAEQDAARLAEALRLAEAALGGYKWLWNNRHNADTRMFVELFEAAHEDEERARASAGEALRLHDERVKGGTT